MNLVLNVLVWVFAALNALFLIVGVGGWWNTTAVVLCVTAGVYGLWVERDRT